MSEEKTPKLHEILAVEADLRATATKITEECIRTFKDKPIHFMKFHRKLEMFVNDGVDHPEEHQEMVTTVSKKLSYVIDHIVRFYDAVFQKECTNQIAVADIEINGTVIAENIPATYLLGLEEKFKVIRNLYEAIPTLQEGKEWKPDNAIGKDIYRNVHLDEKLKTAKTFVHKVLYDATDKHPAQIEKWEEVVNVGKYVTSEWSAMLTPADKSILLERIDLLIRAIKQARQRANTAPLRKDTVARKLFDYIHSQ